MSKYAVSQCWIVFLAPFMFHQSAGAGYVQDWDHVLFTFNPQTDRCSEVKDDSTFEAKDAADNFCKQSFEALDRIKQNYCSGWRLPECRKLPEYDHPVCSCIFSSCTVYGIKINGLSSFRDCAWGLYQEEYHTGRTPATSANFKRKHEEIYDEAKEKSRSRKVARTSHEAGPSTVFRVPRARGPFIGIQNTGDGTTAWSVRVPSAAGTSHSPDKPINTQSTHGPYACDTCGITYKRQTSLSAHKAMHKEDLRCKICNMELSTKASLKRHVEKHLKNSEDEAAIREMSAVNPALGHDFPQDILVCETCGKAYYQRDSLIAHQKVHEEDIRCQFCNGEFSTRSNHRKHIQKFHPETDEAKAISAEKESMRQSYDKQHVCEKCGAGFSKKKTLQEHMAIHRGETHCQFCNQPFSRKAALKKHLKKFH